MNNVLFKGLIDLIFNKGTNMNDKFTILKISDAHIPYEDREVLGSSIYFAQDINPDILIVDEWIDFYAISRFNKDPFRKLELQSEIDRTVLWLRFLRETLPNTNIIMLEGNHDRRLQRYLRSSAEELSYLRALTVESLLQLKDLDIEYRKELQFNGVLYKHGDLVRKYSCYTAKGEFLKEGISGVSGHTHRLGTYYMTDRRGLNTWVEGGCTCKLDADYIKGIANWQQGIVYSTFYKDTFIPEVIPIIDNKLYFRGEILDYFDDLSNLPLFSEFAPLKSRENE